MTAEIARILTEIARLPNNWHDSGTVPFAVLSAIARHTDGRVIRHSIETGSGKTTLLISHLSQDHKVFAIDDGESVSAVRRSVLFNPKHVTYIEGPTQLTLPAFRFADPLQLAVLDGPHAYPFLQLEYYYVYPHLEVGALLILDDIHIPTAHHLFRFLEEDDMFELKEVVGTTAFFQRTDAPTFNPLGDGWRMQKFNARRFPIETLSRKFARISRVALKRLILRKSGV